MSGDRGGTAFRRAALALGFGFLYLPIVVLVAYSFNTSRLVTIWAGFSTHWYGALLDDDKFRDAALTSLEIGVMAASLALVLGTCAGLAMNRFARFRGRAPVRLYAAGAAGGARGHPRPVAAAAVRRVARLARLAGEPRHPHGDDRARDLHLLCRGAGARPAWRASTARSKKPRSISARGRWACCGGSRCRGSARRWSRAGCLAFTMSLDDLVVASFVSGPSATTLPMAVYSSVRIGVTPEINALATLFLAAVFVARRARLLADGPAGAPQRPKRGSGKSPQGNERPPHPSLSPTGGEGCEGSVKGAAEPYPELGEGSARVPVRKQL